MSTVLAINQSNTDNFVLDCWESNLDPLFQEVIMVTIVLWCSLLLFNETRWKLITVENFVGAFSMRKCCKMVKWYFVQPRWRLPLIILLWLHQKIWSCYVWPNKWLIGFKIGRLERQLIGLHLIPEVLVKKVFLPVSWRHKNEGKIIWKSNKANF